MFTPIWPFQTQIKQPQPDLPNTPRTHSTSLYTLKVSLPYHRSHKSTKLPPTPSLPPKQPYIATPAPSEPASHPIHNTPASQIALYTRAPTPCIVPIPSPGFPLATSRPLSLAPYPSCRTVKLVCRLIYEGKETIYTCSGLSR